MRLTQICLIAIGLMLGSRWATAEITASCAVIAKNFANQNSNDVNLWLSIYREINGRCNTEHGITSEADSVAMELKKNEAEKIDVETPEIKSANTKASVKRTREILYPRPLQKSLDISKNEKPSPVSKHKSKNRAKNKRIIKTLVLQVNTSVSHALPAHTDAQKSNKTGSIGAEGWRLNCSDRFGGWNKASEGYISTSGKRLPCAIRP